MKFVPTPQDYLKHMQLQPWMNNGVKLVDNQESINIAEQLKTKLHESEF